MAQLQQLWPRGGFPLSLLAPSDSLSFTWRQGFIRTFLQRDLTQLGVGVPAETLHRFWRMLVHQHGQPSNASQLGISLGGVAYTTVARYLDLLVDTMKSPKVCIRDIGIVHALLNVARIDDLQSHPTRRWGSTELRSGPRSTSSFPSAVV